MTINIEDEPDIIQGDKTQIKQVIVNLIQNALDAMIDEGELTITTKILAYESAALLLDGDSKVGKYAQLKIVDNGVGIVRENLEFVFDPFFSTKPRDHRAGLGLSMAMGVAQRLGGSLRLHSARKTGTTACVLLPLTEEPLEAAPEVGNQLPDGQPHSRCVLVVDDERLLRWAVRKHLEMSDFKVLEAADGAEAVEIFKQEQNSISVVLLDMIMPKKGGQETFHEIRGLKPDVRIILQSGYFRDETIDTLLEEGARGFLHKPYDLDQVSETINRVLAEDNDVTKR